MSEFSLIPDPSHLRMELIQTPFYKKLFEGMENDPLSIERKKEDSEEEFRIKQWISMLVFSCPPGRCFILDPSSIAYYKSYSADPRLKILLYTIANPEEVFLFYVGDVAAYHNGGEIIEDDWDTIAHLALLDI